MLRTSFLTLICLSLAAQDAPKPAPVATPKAETKAAPVVAPKAEAKPAPAAVPKAEVKPTAPAVPKPADKIIAKIGDRFVYQSEVDAAIAGMPPQQQQQMTMVSGGRELYAKSFVEMHLLAAKARKVGIDKTKSYEQKKEVALTQVLASEILAKEGDALKARMQVKDEDVKAYFENNKAQFMTPEKFSARHILVGIKSDRTPTGLTEEEAKAKVTKIEAALKSGKKLEDLTKEFSDDPGSKDKGGLYENITFGQFVPEFEKAVREQEIGKVGPAVKTPFGYHLIQVEKRVPAGQETFEASKEKASAAATKEHQEKVWNEFLGEIKKEIPYQFGGEFATPVAKVPAAPKKATK